MTLTQQKPFFFIDVLNILINLEQEENLALIALFNLDCLSDGSLPNIHRYIQNFISDDMNLNVLRFYLPNQLSMLDGVIESNLLLRVVIGSQGGIIKSEFEATNPGIAKNINIFYFF